MTCFLHGCADLLGCLGQQDPFCLFHDTALQNFGGVAFFDIDGLLGNDLAAVGDFVDEMDGGAGACACSVTSVVSDSLRPCGP